MKRSLKGMLGCSIVAADGQAGKAQDVLFDEEDWRVRHLVAHRTWRLKLDLRYLSREEEEELPRDVLIEPVDLGTPELGWLHRGLSTRMTRSDVEHCPGLSTDAPKSTLYEEEFIRFLGHAPYDHRPEIRGETGYSPPVAAYDHSGAEMMKHVEKIMRIAATSLRSGSELMGYEARGLDGEAGTVSDMIFEVDDWRVVELAVSLSKVRSVLVDIDHVESMSWSDRVVNLDLTRAEVADLPRYRPRSPVNYDASGRAYDFRGRPCLFS